MTLLRREPRSVYRVYAEDEYLEREESETATAVQAPASDFETPLGEDAPTGGWSGLLVVALIVVVAVGVLAIVLGVGGHHSPGRPAPATATVPTRHRVLSAPRPRKVRSWQRARARRSQHARSERRPRARPDSSTMARSLSPVLIAVTRLSSVPDAQIEFGFER